MDTTSAYDDILSAADEFARALAAHPITARYQNALSLIKDDENARSVYERIVNLGKILSETKDTGKDINAEFARENEALRKDLELNPIVSEFVEAQKNYFEMISAVQKKIQIIK
ncbi:MAG TPA: YlbF family regulator [Spirochaetota bacterium]|nr:YlbF family regulator [Spirochaetota bacterium]